MTNALSIGTTLNGNSIQYKIESVLGQGSFGITYKAKGFTVVKGALGEMAMELPNPFAIKEFFMREINTREVSGTITGMTQGSMLYNYAQKFHKEAVNLANMSHPNIVRVIDFIEANNTFYYVMEYIDGEDMNSYLKTHKLSEEEAVSIITDVAHALKYMHENQHMLHLDLKPGNIMRRRSDGHIFLIDFGLSKHYGEDGNPDTSTTVGLGTEGYAPLEQGKRTNGRNDFLPTIDVYSLGATFFKLLTGNTPPAASDVLNDEELIPNELETAGVSPLFQEIVVKAMKPSSKKRIQTVSDFITLLNSSSCFAGNNQEESKKKRVAKPKTKENAASDESTVFIQPQSKGVDNKCNQQDAVSQSNIEAKVKEAEDKAKKEQEKRGRLLREKEARKAALMKMWLWIVVGVIAVVGVIIGVNSNGNSSDSVNSKQSGGAIQSGNNTLSQQISSKTYTANGVSFDMMMVKAGTFTMGATLEMKDPWDDEKPTHQVTLTNDYYIGKTEVTQALWKAVMGDNPSSFEGDNLPVEFVLWYDCQKFISKLNSMTGQNFRLPTEAEWEFAARGGNNSNHYQYSGSNKLDDVAWYDGNSGSKTHAVATKQPNELGVYDMSGNVCEMCSDWFGNYSSGSQTNPAGPNEGSYFVIRGGRFNDDAWLCRSSFRSYDSHDVSYIGFRLVLVP